MFRSISKAAGVIVAGLFAVAGSPAAAQSGATFDAASYEAGVVGELAGFVQPTQADRLTHLENLLKSRGLAYVIEDFQGGEAGKPETGRNLVVSLGGNTGKTIVLTAHYDAKRLADGTLVGGVVDNAASVLSLVRAAALLSKQPLEHPLKIVFFDQEELGLIGSRKYLESHLPGEIAVAVNFDINGEGETVIFGLPRGKESIGTLVLRDICEERAIECLAFPKYPPSDDLSFVAAGVPVVSIAHQPAADARQMFAMLNAPKGAAPAAGPPPKVFTIIHTAADTLEAVEPFAVARASRLAFEMAMRLDRDVEAYAHDSRLN